MDRQLVERLAELCIMAYSETAANLPWFSHEQRIFSDVDTHALCGRIGRDVVIAFRGSASIQNWVTNLDASMIRTDVGGVHRGFWLAATSVSQQIARYIRNVSEPGSRVIYTGHSLGGALAVISARLLQSCGEIEPSAVVTFAAPRVGDLGFVAGLKRQDILQFIRIGDAVPHLPPVIAGFHHATRYQRYLDQGGTIDLDQVDALGVAASHSMTGYGESLKRASDSVLI